MKIYVASSWKNIYQPAIVRGLLKCGYTVYDFRNPEHGNAGFHWEEIDEHYYLWNSEEFRRMLFYPKAERGFDLDFSAMHWADTCVLVLPAG